MKIQITSQDIAKRNEMTAEEWAKYLLDKMTERKSEQLHWMSAGFDAAFGI
jgi:hypothetical protein